AVAKSIAAVQGGAQQIECTVNGIGERAGNASLEEIVMTFKVREERLPYTTNVDTKELYPSSEMLTRLTGQSVQANKAIVGRNAFAHEAGIHQDGMMKDRRTYEIMRAEDVGAPWNPLVLGKHSGRHAVLPNRPLANRLPHRRRAGADHDLALRSRREVRLLQPAVAVLHRPSARRRNGRWVGGGCPSRRSRAMHGDVSRGLSTP